MPSGHWYSLVGHLMGRDGEEWEGGMGRSGKGWGGVGRRDRRSGEEG